MFIRVIRVSICVCAALAITAGAASAQTVGLGPRFSFVRGDLPSATSSTRLFGGTLRIQSSRRVVLETALDYRSEFSEDKTTRVRQTPFQASLLLFPVRTTFSPYLLAGIGVYSEFIDKLGPAGIVQETTLQRKTGWHMGFGGELFVARHAALFADYRFRFVKFGDPEADSDPINIPGLNSLKISHRGSMWTSGMAFYF
jgi:hypothetical protein